MPKIIDVRSVVSPSSPMLLMNSTIFSTAKAAATASPISARPSLSELRGARKSLTLSTMPPMKPSPSVPFISSLKPVTCSLASASLDPSSARRLPSSLSVAAPVLTISAASDRISAVVARTAACAWARPASSLAGIGAEGEIDVRAMRPPISLRIGVWRRKGFPVVRRHVGPGDPGRDQGAGGLGLGRLGLMPR